MSQHTANPSGSVHRPVRLLRHLVAGGLAGAVGTVAMDAVAYRPARRSGDDE